MIPDDITALTDAELDTLARAVQAEQERRTVMADAEQRVTEIVDAYQRAINRADGDEWAQPTSALDAYAMAALVTREGRTFRSLHAANVWDPLDTHGARWWQEVWLTGDGEETTVDPDGPQPWDPATTYYPPAAVTLDGITYDLIHTHASPGWRPDDPAMYAVWKAR